MSKISGYRDDWMDKCGFSLGYNEYLTPDLAHFDIIEEHSIPVWEYYGYKTEKGFYSTSGYIKPFRSIKQVIEQYGIDKKKYWEKDEMGGIIYESD